MEYLKKDELYKNRGYAKCISSGYHAIANNYKNIFSYTWKSALVYFLVIVAALSLTNGFSLPTSTFELVTWIVMMIAVASSKLYLIAHIINIFTEQGKLPVFKKLVVLLLWNVLIAAVIFIIMSITVTFSYTSDYYHEIVASVVAVTSIITFVLGMPFMYLFVKYLAEDEKNFFKVIKDNYTKGFRHWGLIFVTFILSIFFVTAATFVVVLPYYILTVAKLLSSSGVMLGDESGMPSYFPFVYALTTAVVWVIVLYFNFSIFSTMYYTYGSIEQRENERIGFMEDSM